MCLLTFIPAGNTPDKKLLQKSCDNNPHGFGYAIINGDQVITGKSLNANHLIKEFLLMRKKYPNGDALFHSRYATHGTISVDNCHPFIVGRDKKTVLAHNGILPVITPKIDDRSDTAIFAEDILPLYLNKKGGIDNKEIFEAIEDWAYGSKMVLLTVNPKFNKNSYIFNEKSGHWLDGIWWSNYGYVSQPKAAKNTGLLLPYDYTAECFQCGFINNSYSEKCYRCQHCLECLYYFTECDCYNEFNELNKEEIGW